MSDQRLADTLLSEAEREVVSEELGLRIETPFVLLCDHASARVPAALDLLGLAADDLTTHIAWDIGARDVVARITERLRTRAVLAGFSRLVADCNRYPWDESFIPARVDGIDIPGNADLSWADRQRRLEEVFLPYQAACQRLLLDALAAHRCPVILSIHSMTPALQSDGQHRPWAMSICWSDHNPLAARVVAALRERDIVVGDNQPYSLDIGIDFTVGELALRRGLPHLQVEFRQDLIESRAGAVRYADLFVDGLLDAIAHDSGSLEGTWPRLPLRQSAQRKRAAIVDRTGGDL